MGEGALRQAADAATEDALSPEATDLLKAMAPCSLSLGDVNDEVRATKAFERHTLALLPPREKVGACSVLVLAAPGSWQNQCVFYAEPGGGISVLQSGEVRVLIVSTSARSLTLVPGALPARCFDPVDGRGVLTPK